MEEQSEIEENHLPQQPLLLLLLSLFCYDRKEKNKAYNNIKKNIKIPKKLTHKHDKISKWH